MLACFSMKASKAKSPSELIAEDLENLGYTQRQLANEMGVDFSIVSRLVNGRLGISVERARQLSHVTGRDGWEYVKAQAWQLWTAVDQS